MTTPTATTRTNNGLVALLDLPVQSTITLDGQSITLQRDDFVGIAGVPSNGEDDFHLVTVRAGAPPQQQQSGGAGSTTVGFVLSPTQPLVRRYDPRTEEVSSEPVDEPTASNLLEAIRQGRIERQRLVAYSDVVRTPQAWDESTRFITIRFVTQKRGIRVGEKIVPGAYEGDDDDDVPMRTNNSRSTTTEQDGTAVDYPPIPVIDKSHSLRAQSKHSGTQRFLKAHLSSASERTSLFFTETDPASHLLEMVLKLYYDGQWQDLLGDLQLAFVLFQNLHCYSSWMHWRDLVAMLCRCELEGVSSHLELYTNLVQVVYHQLVTMDADFFQDSELSSDDNVLLSSLRCLVSTLSQVVDSDLTPWRIKLVALLKDRFPESDSWWADAGTDSAVDMSKPNGMQMDDEDDEDGPVIVSTEDVEASMSRSAAVSTGPCAHETYSADLRQQYPILFAAVMPHEDVVMTCARALDEKNDVSLVREAAAYLEEVEAKKAKEHGFTIE